MPPVSLALLHFFLFWTYLNKRKQYLKKKKSLALLDIVYYLFVLHQNCDIIRFQTEPVVVFLNGGLNAVAIHACARSIRALLHL